ncbi:MAG: metal ABC transporter ATP-binding protein [Patescibacteria group bacterium]
MPVKTDQPCIELRGVSFGYGPIPVVENISLKVEEGEYLGIIGPNGGGKTTILKLMMGLLEPSAGEVLLFGEPVRRSKRRSAIGYVQQRHAMDPLFPASVEEVVVSGRTAMRGLFRGFTKHDLDVAVKALDTAGVGHLRRRKISSLSGGERQRVLIARALAGEPEILFLDEPTSAVDAPSQEAFYAFISDLHRKAKLSIIMVSHDIDAVSHQVQSVACLNRHVTCHGPTEQILRSGKLKAVFQEPPEIRHQHP